MESRAHAKANYTTGGKMSFMAHDLLECSENFQDSFKARAAIRDRATNSAKKPHVGIVGAGFAGLRCAEILVQKGFHVTILEARDRIGGRVCQTNFANHTVDL
jgi:NADPH-dependent 2,4-dienoyl-CoA reductase/sulfur reductase-like enzyme